MTATCLYTIFDGSHHVKRILIVHSSSTPWEERVNIMKGDMKTSDVVTGFAQVQYTLKVAKNPMMLPLSISTGDERRLYSTFRTQC